MSAYSLLLVARYNCPKAMDAKQSEKILYGSTSGKPSRLSEKYQSPCEFLPFFLRNSALFIAKSSHSCFFSTRLYSMAKLQTCRAWSQINLSVSYTFPRASRQVKYPPESFSFECASQKGIASVNKFSG